MTTDYYPMPHYPAYEREKVKILHLARRVLVVVYEHHNYARIPEHLGLVLHRRCAYSLPPSYCSTEPCVCPQLKTSWRMPVRHLKDNS